MLDENDDLVNKPTEVLAEVESNDQTLNTVDSEDSHPKSKLVRFVNFIKKHKISVSIIAGLLLILTALFIFIPVINIGTTRLVNVGSVVRLEKNQFAKLKIRDVSVRIVNFTNDVCPTGQKCFGANKKAVEYILTENGKSYATGSETVAKDTSYKITTVSSDYSTYADIKIVKSK